MGTFGAAPWSQEMKDMFSERFAAGDSYPMIMAAMNRAFPGHPVSRSAICGHAFRNKYRRGRVKVRPGPKPKKQRQKRISMRARKMAEKAAVNAELREQQQELGLDEIEEGQTLMNQPCWFGLFDKSVALEELSEEICRWPLQVDGCDATRFCYNKKARGSYCLAHAQLSYALPRARQSSGHRPSWGR
jgi:hypothetical protein